MCKSLSRGQTEAEIASIKMLGYYSIKYEVSHDVFINMEKKGMQKK